MPSLQHLHEIYSVGDHDHGHDCGGMVVVTFSTMAPRKTKINHEITRPQTKTQAIIQT
jgi:hypothetical protein